MNFKTFFKYEPKVEHDFTLESTQDVSINPIPEGNMNQKVFNSIEKNIEYMKSEYNQLINSDITFREFLITSCNTAYRSLLIYIDGMINPNLINDFVLKPLMIKNENSTFNNILLNHPLKITAKKIKKDDFKDFIYNRLIPQNSIVMETEFKKIISGINSGNCALFIDKINVAYNIDVKGFQQRNIDRPEIENVIKGPQ